jgi:hypothetical protein
MKRLFRWVIRLSLGLLAVLIVAFGALFIFDRVAAVLLIAILIYPLVGNTQPPPIAEDQLAAPNLRDASRNLSTLLQRKFPPGSSEGTLISTLSKQGFRPTQGPDGSEGWSWCMADPNDPTAQCGAYDPSKIYKYSWSEGIVCGSNIMVWWTTDDHGNLLKVMGEYRTACL